MECNRAEEILDAYLLGALDTEDRQLIEEHLQGCQSCSLKLQGDGETMARLAMSIPILDAPSSVKERLLAKVDADIRSDEMTNARRLLIGYWVSVSQSFRAYSAKIGVGVLVIGLVFGGFLFNDQMNQLVKDNQELNERLDEVSEKNQDLAVQFGTMAEREEQVVQMVTNQRSFTYEALRLTTTPGTTVNKLWGTGVASQASGMVVFSRTSPYGMLLTFGLPPLPEDKVYQVWLVKDGVRYGAGQFDVDSTGFGQAVIIPTIPFSESAGVGITIEPRGGSEDPTGTNVLKGDL